MRRCTLLNFRRWCRLRDVGVAPLSPWREPGRNIDLEKIIPKGRYVRDKRMWSKMQKSSYQDVPHTTIIREHIVHFLCKKMDIYPLSELTVSSVIIMSEVAKRTSEISFGSPDATNLEERSQTNPLKGDMWRDSSLSKSDIVNDICEVERFKVLVRNIVEIEEFGKNLWFRNCMRSS